jgi:GH24 family phage-related lysozyme (muramidase)
MAKPFPEMTKDGLEALKVSEGYVPYVYDDAVYPTRRWKKGTKVKGFLTAGVGHLLNETEIATWAGKDIPASVIDAWLDADTDEAERDVHEYVKVKLQPKQRNTLISFRFNIGRSAFKGSTLVRKLNNGDYDSVPSELRKWNKTTINGKKVVSDGLIKRRADEIAMWLSGAVPVATPGVRVRLLDWFPRRGLRYRPTDRRSCRRGYRHQTLRAHRPPEPPRARGYELATGPPAPYPRETDFGP